MSESRFAHAVVSAVLSALAATWAWFAVHGQAIATLIAIVAGITSIVAGVQTIQVRRLEKKKLK